VVALELGQSSSSGPTPSAGGIEVDRPAALIGAADFFPRVASSLAPLLGFLMLHWSKPLSDVAGLPSNILLLISLVAVPGIVSALQSALLKLY